MTFRQAVLALSVLLVAIAAGVAVAKAPLYARYTADECRGAYLRAKTMGDTARVDAHPYLAATGPRARRRCGELRTRVIGDTNSFLPR